ncbi:MULTISPECIES: hypothetical protein [Paenibacillus]|uniref:Uncharacterized protein n=1 Tax=Paenibacillus borealis TaxID=160799 RepID=A0ABX3H1J7_PAEBO|nr:MULTISPECIES: hypothetical protein [Paenibacillus]AIQ15644.1 hypothetical protein H70357_02210 [Paenibacillus sp. FSL H7-0357]OMD40266.1 hypothetical protein BSK56_28885 [Paenibacillus borealis]
MNKIKDYDLPSVRLSAGMYALAKLSAAGLTFMLVSLLMLFFPHEGGVPEGWPISVPYAIYAYGLPAALLADLLLRMFRSSSLGPSLVLYAAAGFGAGLWLASEQGGEAMTCGIYGIAVLLVFRLAQVAGERQPLLLPVFALFIPLLCLLLL